MLTVTRTDFMPPSRFDARMRKVNIFDLLGGTTIPYEQATVVQTRYVEADVLEVTAGALLKDYSGSIQVELGIDKVAGTALLSIIHNEIDEVDGEERIIEQREERILSSGTSTVGVWIDDLKSNQSVLYSVFSIFNEKDMNVG